MKLPEHMLYRAREAFGFRGAAVVDHGKCRATVLEPPHYLHSHQCSRKPVAEHDGYGLCKQHGRIWEEWKRRITQSTRRRK